MDDPCTEELSVICLPPPCDSWPEPGPDEEILGQSDIGDLITLFLYCLFGVVILIVRGRHFEREESTTLSLSCFKSGDLQPLHLELVRYVMKNFHKKKEEITIFGWSCHKILAMIVKES